MEYKRYAAAFAAALCLCGAVSCGSGSSSSSVSEKTTAAAEASESTSADTSAVTGTPADNDTVTEKGTADLGEKVIPAADDAEFELGEYYVSPSGIKLYFDTEEFPAELALFMEKYFTSYANNDFKSYESCLYPSYIDEMNKFLQKDYSYGLETSFNNQCDSLRTKIGGEYAVTRIKLEKHEGDISKFFEYPSSCFDKDYYAEIKDEPDKFYDMEFYIMAKCSDKDEEELLVGEYEIVFAEKDGRFYTFG